MSDGAHFRPWGSFPPRGLAAICIAALQRDPPGDVRRFLYRVMEWISPQYDIELSGVKLRCHPNDNLTERCLIVDRSFHDGELARIVDVLTPGDHFVDAGANCGIFSCRAASIVGPTGRVLAIEPNPPMIERLRVNVRLNGFTNVDIAVTAVGDTQGTATLHIIGKEQARSSFHAAAVRDRRKTVAVTVPVAPLLSVLSAHGFKKIDAMKIDIEGFEDRALIPFFEMAPPSLWPTRILMETVNRRLWQSDCLEHLLQLGYVSEWHSTQDVLLVRTPS